MQQAGEVQGEEQEIVTGDHQDPYRNAHSPHRPDEEVKAVPTLPETTLRVARVLPHVELVAETSEYPGRDGAIRR